MLVLLLLCYFFLQLVDGNHDYSYIMLTYNQEAAARKAFHRLRHFYPKAPIYILVDKGGDNISDLCKSDEECQYTESSIHYGHDFQIDCTNFENSTLLKMKDFFGHFKKAAIWGNRTYLVYIEEDVWMQHPFESHHVPKGDVGGIYNPWFGSFLDPAVEYINNQPGSLNMSLPTVIFAASYYRTAALVDCVDRVLPTVDWRAIHALDNRIPMTWDTVPPVLFALGGYSIEPWEASCEFEVVYKEKYGTYASFYSVLILVY